MKECIATATYAIFLKPNSNRMGLSIICTQILSQNGIELNIVPNSRDFANIKFYNISFCIKNYFVYFVFILLFLILRNLLLLGEHQITQFYVTTNKCMQVSTTK